MHNAARLLPLAEAALVNREEELGLTERRFELGAASRLEVNRASVTLYKALGGGWHES